MKIEYDVRADALYIRYNSNPVSVTRDSAEAIVDYDRDGNVVGIEMLGVQELFQKNNLSLQDNKLVTH